MSLAHDNFVQAQKLIENATRTIAKAKGLIDKSIVIDAMPNTAPDSQKTYWAQLSTDLAAVLTDLATATADVYFYPEKVHA